MEYIYTNFIVFIPICPYNLDPCITEPSPGSSFSAHREVFCRELSLNTLFRLPYHCSVFQSEVTAIKVAVDVLLPSAASFRKVCIHYDGRMAR